METKSIIMIAIVIILGIILYFGMNYLKVRQQNKMVELLQNGEFDQFFALTDSLLTKYLFPRYNVEYLKLNGYIIKGEEANIEKQFDFLLNARKNKAQTEDITMKAFNYYVGIENKEKSTELLEQIQSFTNERMVKEAETMYDIFILKNGNHIEELLTTLEKLPEEGKAVNEYLLSVQYENIGDKENAKKYEKLSKKHMESTAKQKKNKS